MFLNKLLRSASSAAGVSSPLSVLSAKQVYDFTLPPLPYARNALEPLMSKETIDFHYGKHHQTYVTNLKNFADKDESLKNKSLVDLVKTTNGATFNQAAQIYNHSFFWSCLAPQNSGGGGNPTGNLKLAIERDFGGVDKFKEEFTKNAVGHFGSGWAWLVKDGNGKLSVLQTHDAACPLTQGLNPLLVVDVWEHAYYIDHRNVRPSFVNNFWSLVNWKFVGDNFDGSSKH